MRLYLVRHGETGWNVEKRLQGRTDIQLNEKGVRLARITGESLRDIAFDLAFSSPLSRAVETARLILGDRMVKIIPDDRIMEISFGPYEGMKFGGGNYEIPDPAFQNFFRDPEHYQAPEGGESLKSLMRRTADFIGDLAAREELAEKNILVTTHGAAVRGLINAVKQMPVKDFWNGSVPKNCSVSIVECTNGRMELIQENKVYYAE